MIPALIELIAAAGLVSAGIWGFLSIFSGSKPAPPEILFYDPATKTAEIKLAGQKESLFLKKDKAGDWRKVKTGDIFPAVQMDMAMISYDKLQHERRVREEFLESAEK